MRSNRYFCYIICKTAVEANKQFVIYGGDNKCMMNYRMLQAVPIEAVIYRHIDIYTYIDKYHVAPIRNKKNMGL